MRKNDKAVIEYQNIEIAMLKKNLKKLSEGDFYIEFNTENDLSINENEDFKQINQYISKIAVSMKNLTDDTDMLASFIRSGDIEENKEFRINNKKYEGKYSTVIDNVNDIYSYLLNPLRELWNILGVMCNNDFSARMSNNYQGDFKKLSVILENLLDKMIYMQNCAVKIASGDTSEIEKLKSIGKRSDKDELVPAFLQMNLAVKEIIDETQRLANKAADGDLSDRGDTTKLKGAFKDIVNDINNMLDAVAIPMQEVTTVMEQMSIGNLQVSIDSEFKGEYAKLVDAVNNTVKILNNVVQEIGTNLTSIANTDLNISRIRDYKGDFNNISNACNLLIDELNEMVREIYTAAQQVASGSGQIADTSVMLSQGSEEQASSIEEVTSSITQMAAQVQQNAANASQADSLSITAKDSAIKGDEQMEKMIGAMHDINESSSNISKIIKVIDDIAFQTNILALNAAVEAARAGQYGKGFAVVAEEVRNLAQKSASAAQETTAMIENSIEKVKFGTDIANNTEKALKEIVVSVTKSSDLVGQIASASNEQASAISQVSQAIEQVSEVVQTNSATAEESASASEELTGQAEMLKNMVSKFVLRNETDNKLIDINSLTPELIDSIEGMLQNSKQKEKSNDKTSNQKEPRKVSVNSQIDFNGEF